MNAYQIPGLQFSVPAGGEVKRRRFVTINAAGACIHALLGGLTIGASKNEVNNKTGVDIDKQIVEVADGIVIVEAGGVIAAGDSITVGTDGVAVKGTEGVVGIAMTDASKAGVNITVKLI